MSSIAFVQSQRLISALTLPALVRGWSKGRPRNRKLNTVLLQHIPNHDLSEASRCLVPSDPVSSPQAHPDQPKNAYNPCLPTNPSTSPKTSDLDTTTT
jgi:hypothetical protein